MDPRVDLTQLLSAAAAGDSAATDKLWSVVQGELHRIARNKMRQELRHGDLQTTVLVQEAYLRLIGSDTGLDLPSNRRLFFSAAANAMREFLVDNARKRDSQKRGGGRVRHALHDLLGSDGFDAAEVLAINDALDELRLRDARKAEIVHLRYFMGMTIEETADVLDVSPRLIAKEWRFARAWLHRVLE